MVKKTHSYLERIPFSSKQAALRELGRSHLLITICSLIILLLLLNASYRFIDISGGMVRPLVLTASVLVAIVTVLSMVIAYRAYVAANHKK